jgi:AAA domain
MARCPAHDDRKPSLSVAEGRGGATLLTCHAGCSFSAIVSALGVEPSALGSQNGSADATYVLEETYVYHNPDWSIRYRVQRKVNPFDRKDKQYPQNPSAGKDGWTTGKGCMDGVERILYRLPELLAADPTEPVFICEGEKCTDAVRELGLVATCNSGGAGKFAKGGGADYLEALRGRELVILTDSDLPDPKRHGRRKGHDHEQDVALKVKPIARCVKAFELPGVPADGGDVFDWIKAGGSRDQLLELAAMAPEWTETELAPEADSFKEPFFIHANDLFRIEPAEVIPNTHFVRNGLNVIFGPSEAGKTFYQIAQSIEVSQSERVVYIAAEGSGGFDARIKAYCSHYRLEVGELYFHLLQWNLLDSLCIDNFIQNAKSKFGSIAMVVVDTFARALVGGDENSAKDVGLAIANATAIQKALRCAVVIVHHSNRAGHGERGSGALRGAADAMLEVANDDGLIAVSCSKFKDGPKFDAEYFRLVSWGGSAVLLPAKAVVVDRDELTAQQLKILSALSLEVFQNGGAKHSQLSELTKLPESSLYRSLSSLKRAGFLGQGARGNPYTITEAGQERLQQEKDKLSPSIDRANSLSRADISSELSASQLPLNALSESPSLYSPRSHTPLGVRAESRSESGSQKTQKQAKGSVLL